MMLLETDASVAAGKFAACPLHGMSVLMWNDALFTLLHKYLVCLFMKHWGYNSSIIQELHCHGVTRKRPT